MGGQRRRRHDEWGHGFLIHGEELRNQGVERTTRGMGNEFLITSEEVGIEGAEAMEEEGWARFFYHMGNGWHRRR